MRVAMLQAFLPPAPQAGGVGYQVDLLASHLVSRGHDVTAFALGGAGGARPYRTVAVPSGTSRWRRLLGTGLAFSRLDLSSFDVVHAHGDDWRMRRPHVRTYYGTALMEARSATTWRRRGSQMLLYGLEWVSSANRFSVGISASTSRCLPLVRSRIPCAFDPGVFFAGGKRSEHPSILFVAGTLLGRKRGGLLLDVFAAVRRAIPGATLTIVSEDAVDRPGVTCLRQVTASDLGELYRSHWLLLSTSSYEGFGVPYIESMASALPVVATPNPGAIEVLGNGAHGVLAPPERLARAVIELIRDDARRRNLSAAGLDASRSFSVDVVARQYEELYRRLLAAGSANDRVGREHAAVDEGV
jgi:phosphatidyl-myo-inositol alpha-mannosyltransferase